MSNPTPDFSSLTLTLTLTLPADLRARLEALATREDKGLETLSLQALEEFCDHWEEYHRTCEALDAGAEDRVALHDPVEA